MLDTRYRLSAGYAPSDLVAVTDPAPRAPARSGRSPSPTSRAMFRAARAAGAPFAVQSAYRSYKTQVATFNRWVLEEGYASAIRGSARPGHSEHQLGTALDLKTPGGAEPWDLADWGAHEGRRLARPQQLALRLDHQLPEGEVAGRNLLPLRAVARPLLRADDRAARSTSRRLAAREWLYVKGATRTWTGGGSPEPDAHAKPTPSRRRNRHRRRAPIRPTSRPALPRQTSPGRRRRAPGGASVGARGSVHLAVDPSLRALAGARRPLSRAATPNRSEALPRLSQITIATANRATSDEPVERAPDADRLDDEDLERQEVTSKITPISESP